MKRVHYLPLLWVLFGSPINLHGQDTVEKTGLLERFFERLAVSKADTAYAVRYPYHFSVKPKLGTSLGLFSFDWTENGIDKKYTIRSKPIWKAGVNVSYRNLTIGFQRDVSRFLGSGKSDDSEYSASAYGTMLGGDFFYNVSGRYTILDEDDEKWSVDMDCFQSKRLQANGYFVFNHRRFSYPAAFTQSYHQKKSCGSFVAGLSLSYEYLEFDAERLPEEVAERVDASEYAHEISYRSFSVNGGYAYNWVISRRWMMHGSVIPSFSIFKKAIMEFADRTEELKVDKVNVGCIFRMGVLWDRSRYFGGFTAVITANSLSREPVDMSDFYVRTRMFYGFRF